jgi:hypothetical protein
MGIGTTENKAAHRSGNANTRRLFVVIGDNHAHCDGDGEPQL